MTLNLYSLSFPALLQFFRRKQDFAGFDCNGLTIAIY